MAYLIDLPYASDVKYVAKILLLNHLGIHSFFFGLCLCDSSHNSNTVFRSAYAFLKNLCIYMFYSFLHYWYSLRNIIILAPKHLLFLPCHSSVFLDALFYFYVSKQQFLLLTNNSEDTGILQFTLCILHCPKQNKCRIYTQSVFPLHAP